MKIVFFETKPWEKTYLEKTLTNHALGFFEDPLTPDTVGLIKETEAIVTFIYSKVDKAILKKLPRLKLVVTKSTGFDHIEVAECARRKIIVCNVPFYGENTVAEHTFALMLSLSRNIHTSYIRTLKGDFSIEGLQGFDLKNKTLGVIGTGHIGLHVIKMAKGFGMKVIAYDVKQNNFMTEVLGFEYTTLDDLLRRSDIITIHVPYNQRTHHLLNRATLAHAKRGAILINTARGGIVDTDALLWALENKILKGAGLDVVEGEELIKEERQLLHDHNKTQVLAELTRDHKLLAMDNVVFTPHIAFYSQEALQRIIETTAQNIIAFTNGQPMNLV